MSCINDRRLITIQQNLKQTQIEISHEASFVKLHPPQCVNGSLKSPHMTVYIRQREDAVRQIPDLFHELTHVISLGCIYKKNNLYLCHWGILTLQLSPNENHVCVVMDHELEYLNEALTNLTACFLQHYVEKTEWTAAWKNHIFSRKLCSFQEQTMRSLVYAYLANNVTDITTTLIKHTGKNSLKEIQQILLKD